MATCSTDSCLQANAVTAVSPSMGANELLYKIALLLSYLVNSTTNISGSPTFQAAPDITVVNAGTAQNGVSVATPKGVMVVAALNNNGSVYVGGSEVSNSSGGKRGAELSPLGMPSVVLPISNLDQLYVDSDNDGNRVGVLIL